MEKTVLSVGPDLSYHNGIVNMKKLKESGCKRVGLRAGYGKGNVDEKYEENALACFNLGIDVVLYWFSYAYSIQMALEEADAAIVQAAKYWTRCPIAYDFEYDSVNYANKKGIVISRETASGMAAAFLKKVREAGYIPVLYTNKDYKQRYFDLAQIAKEAGDFYLWYARYTNRLPAEEMEEADIWQFTSEGKLEGVSGNVDLNRFYTDFGMPHVEYAQRMEAANLNILSFQKAANEDGYRDMDKNSLKEDGIDGPKTRYVRKQILMRAKISGVKVKSGSKGSAVRWWQERCNAILGHNNSEDGVFGIKTRAETLQLQKKLLLKEDGVAGYYSIQAVFYH